jgi:hypothetical protein
MFISISQSKYVHNHVETQNMFSINAQTHAHTHTRIYIYTYHIDNCVHIHLRRCCMFADAACFVDHDLRPLRGTRCSSTQRAWIPCRWSPMTAAGRCILRACCCQWISAWALKDAGRIFQGAPPSRKTGYVLRGMIFSPTWKWQSGVDGVRKVAKPSRKLFWGCHFVFA